MEAARAVLGAIRRDDKEALRAWVPQNIESFMCLDLRQFEKDQILLGQPPLLSIAVYFGAERCARYLVDCGAGLDATDNFGREPVHFLASPHNVEKTFRFLVGRGVAFDAADESDMTVLHYLVRTQQVGVVREILGKRLCASTKSSRGETPFEIAVSCGNSEMVQVMLELRGVGQVYEVNAWDIAKRSGNAEMMKLLNEAVPAGRMRDGKTGIANLWDAAQRNDLRMAAEAIKNGADVNKLDANGLSALSYAVMSGNMEMATWLLDHQASPLIGAPMKYAVATGSLPMVALLVQRIGDVNSVDDNNQTPLGYAVDSKFSPEIFGLLVKNGAGLSVGNSEEVSPIDIIMRIRNPKIIEAMKQNNVPLDVDMRYSLTHSAAKVKDSEFLSVIIKNGGDVNFCYQGATPLEVVLNDSLSSDDSTAREDITYLFNPRHFEQQFASALLLIENGASFRNMLQNALEVNDQLTVFFLLVMGAPVPRDRKSVVRGSLVHDLVEFFGNKDQRTAWIMVDNSLLQLAVQFSPVSVVKLLIEMGLDIDAEDAQCLRPIHHALLKCRFAVANLLIDYCASLLPPDMSNPSLLSFVAGNEQMNVAKAPSDQFDRVLVETFVNLMIESGVSIDACDVNGISPLALACKTKNFRFAEVLLLKGAKNVWSDECSFFRNLVKVAPNDFADKFENDSDLIIGKSSILTATTDPRRFIVDDGLSTVAVLRLMTLYLSSGHNVNDCVEESTRSTALHLACSRSLLTVCRFLVLNGASLDILNSQKLSPMSTALIHGDVSLIKALLRNARDLDARDCLGRTPFLYACMKQGPPVLKMLLEHGASFSFRDCSGKSPMHIAAKSGNLTALEFLISDCKG